MEEGSKRKSRWRGRVEEAHVCPLPLPPPPFNPLLHLLKLQNKRCSLTIAGIPSLIPIWVPHPGIVMKWSKLYAVLGETGIGGRTQGMKNVTLYTRRMWSLWLLLLMVFIHFDFSRAVPVVPSAASWTTRADLSPLAATVEDVTAVGTSWTTKLSDDRSNILIIQADPGGPNTSIGPSPGPETTEGEQSTEGPTSPSRNEDNNGNSHETKSQHSVLEVRPKHQSLFAVKTGAVVLLGTGGGNNKDEEGGVDGGGRHLPFVQSRPPGVSTDHQVIPEIWDTVTSTGGGTGRLISPHRIDQSITGETTPSYQSLNNNQNNIDINDNLTTSVFVKNESSSQGVNSSLPFHVGVLLDDNGGVHGANDSILAHVDASDNVGAVIDGGGEFEEGSTRKLILSNHQTIPNNQGSTVILPLPQRDLTTGLEIFNNDDVDDGAIVVTTSGSIIPVNDINNNNEGKSSGVFIPILTPLVTTNPGDTQISAGERDERYPTTSTTYQSNFGSGIDESVPDQGKQGNHQGVEGILLTTMISVLDTSEGSTPKAAGVNPIDGSGASNTNNRFDVGNLQFDLKDIILAVCGTVACMFTLCMLVTFTRCCCKKPKEDSDEEQPPVSHGTSASTSKSLWKRSWRRPLDSAATTHTQDSSTSENITQVTIERRESYTDQRDSGGETSDDEEGGFTCGRSSRNTDTAKSRKSNYPESDDNKNALSVKDRIRAFEAPSPQDPGEVKVREGVKPRKNKPTSKAFEEFESKGILIGFGGGPRRRHGDEDEEHDDGEGICDSPIGILLPSPTSGLSQEDTPTSSRGLEDDEGVHTMDSEEDEFAAIQRNTEILKSFRRAPPPKNRSKSRRSGRGRRPMRGQDVSSSEQIAEEPSSGSFGSRPTSGINSPATSATPEEEHDSFEASLHMTTTESLSAARSSSISQTPQSSMDSMDSPKRQPSLSSRDSPLRGSLNDSPKRLLDSPKRQVRESSKRASDFDRSPGSYQPTDRLLHEKNGHPDFSLNIPMDFQQQRLGVHHQLSPQDGGKVLGGGGAGGKPHRPKSYHVDLASSSLNNTEASHRVPSDRVRPLRPMSQVQPHHELDLFSRDPPSHDLDVGSHDQKHLHVHEPQQQRDTISLSHGHLARNISSPVGRVLPQVRQPSSPGELRRWESEHSYLQEEGWKPSRLREAKHRPRMSSPDQPSSSGSQARELQTLRPTLEENQVREHPQSERLERKVLQSETPETSPQAPDHLNDQGVTGVPTSEKVIFLPNRDVPPPRPPLPSWRQINPPWKPESSDSKEIPPRSPVKLSYVANAEVQHQKPHSHIRRERSFIVNKERSFVRASLNTKTSTQQAVSNKHFSSDPDIKSVLSKSLPRRDYPQGHELNAEFTQSMDFERNWRDSSNRRGRSLDRAQYTAPIDTRFVQSNPDVFHHSHSLTAREIPLRDLSPDQVMRQSARRRNLIRNDFMEGPHPDMLPGGSNNANMETVRVKTASLPASKSWHGTSAPPQTDTATGDQEIPWLRPLEENNTENIKPSDVRKSLRKARAKSMEEGRSTELYLSTLQADYPRPVEDISISAQNQEPKERPAPLYQATSTGTPGTHRSRKDKYESNPQTPLDFKRNDRRSQSLRTPKSPEVPRRPEMRRSMRDTRTRYTDPEINRRLNNLEFMRPPFKSSQSWEERSATFPRQQAVLSSRPFETGTYRPPQGQKLIASDPYLKEQRFSKQVNNEKKRVGDNVWDSQNNHMRAIKRTSSSQERVMKPNVNEPITRREILPDTMWDTSKLTKPPTGKSPEPKLLRGQINLNQSILEVPNVPPKPQHLQNNIQHYTTEHNNQYHHNMQQRSPHNWPNIIEKHDITVNTAYEMSWNNAKLSQWDSPNDAYGENVNGNRDAGSEEMKRLSQELEVQYNGKPLSPLNLAKSPSAEPRRHQSTEKLFIERVVTPKTVSRGTDTASLMDMNCNPREDRPDGLWQDETGCIKRNVTVQTEEFDQPDWKEDINTGVFYPKSLPLNGNMPPDISSSIDTNLNTWEAIDGPAGNLEPNDHKVLRFTQDPRWKDSLVKPEVTNMYDRNFLLERHQSQDVDVAGRYGDDVDSIQRSSSQQSLNVAAPKMRSTPDVIPISERPLRQPTQAKSLVDTDYHFTFNFEVEATEI